MLCALLLLLGPAWADGPATVLTVGDRPVPPPPPTEGAPPRAPTPDSWVQSLQDCLTDRRPEGFQVADRRTPGATAVTLAAALEEWASLSPTHVVIRLSTDPAGPALAALLDGLKTPEGTGPSVLLLLPAPVATPEAPAPAWAPVVADRAGVTVLIDGTWHTTEQGNARVGARICDAILPPGKSPL